MIKCFDRLKKFDYLVRHSMTGYEKECAQKLEISKSRFYEFLDDIKLLGIPIEWNKIKHSCLYKIPGKVIIGFEDLEEMNKDSLRHVKGGHFSCIRLKFRISP